MAVSLSPYSTRQHHVADTALPARGRPEPLPLLDVSDIDDGDENHLPPLTAIRNTDPVNDDYSKVKSRKYTRGRLEAEE